MRSIWRKDALESIDRALAIEHDNTLAFNNRGHVFWRLNRAQEAPESLEDTCLVLWRLRTADFTLCD